MLVPEVVGFKLEGKLKEGTTATDLVLTVTQMLRARGVVGKFVEFYGPGLDELSLADRATISNMAPEYGATCGFFPIDQETINYLNFTARDEERVKLVEAYAKAQGMWRDADTPDPIFTDTLTLDVSTVEPSLAGPKRPQDRVLLSSATKEFLEGLPALSGNADGIEKKVPVKGTDYSIGSGDVIIAAITSCTNTSNPNVMLAAGLVARNARAKGLQVKPWVKTSLAPGSKVVTDYLVKAGLQDDLDALGFNLVGYGCTTCIGNSGPVAEPIADAIAEGDLVACSVLSGNRNFEGRVSPQAKANYLASPPLVVAYAIAGSLNIDITKDPLGQDTDGNPVYLKDIWPSNQEILETVRASVSRDMFVAQYANVFTGDEAWQAIETAEGQTYSWNSASTYVQHPPYFEGMQKEAGGFNDIEDARILALLADSVTTDHISPAGAIKEDSPAGEYLKSNQVSKKDFNSYGSRRGNHEVMMRGTFANIRLRNEMAPGTEGGVTRHMPDGEQQWIYDASMQYQKDGVPLVVFAGKEYGTGSSRDWAAKGTLLLGIKAVVAESFERIHRSNLVGMGIIPLQFPEGVSRKTLGLDGSETVSITGLKDGIKPRMTVPCTIKRSDGSSEKVELICRIDTVDEVEYYRHEGILQYVLRDLSSS
jgi:aconitate hydratase